MISDISEIGPDGRVAIPPAIRDRFGLREGARLVFEETAEGDLRVRALDEAGLDAWRRVQRAVSARAEAEGLTPEDVDRAVERAREELHAERAADGVR